MTLPRPTSHPRWRRPLPQRAVPRPAQTLLPTLIQSPKQLRRPQLRRRSLAGAVLTPMKVGRLQPRALVESAQSAVNVNESVRKRNALISAWAETTQAALQREQATRQRPPQLLHRVRSSRRSLCQLDRRFTQAAVLRQLRRTAAVALLLSLLRTMARPMGGARAHALATDRPRRGSMAVAHASHLPSCRRLGVRP